MWQNEWLPWGVTTGCHRLCGVDNKGNVTVCVGCVCVIRKAYQRLNNIYSTISSSLRSSRGIKGLLSIDVSVYVMISQYAETYAYSILVTSKHMQFPLLFLTSHSCCVPAIGEKAFVKLWRHQTCAPERTSLKLYLFKWAGSISYIRKYVWWSWKPNQIIDCQFYTLLCIEHT